MTTTAYGYIDDPLRPSNDEPVEITTTSVQDAAIEMAFRHGYPGFIIKRTGSNPSTTFWLNNQPSGVPRKVTRREWANQVIRET